MNLWKSTSHQLIVEPRNKTYWKYIYDLIAWPFYPHPYETGLFFYKYHFILIILQKIESLSRENLIKSARF